MKKGLIYTDSLRLALKYGCDRDRICHILERFVSESTVVGWNWELLDLGDGFFDEMLMDCPGWRGYHAVLEEFSLGLGIENGIETGLFIIGGDDVIPMPSVRNDAARHAGREEKEANLEADYLYCLPQSSVRVDTHEDSVDIRSAMSAVPRFSVGRLPLEDGDLKTTPEADIGRYFERSITEFRDNGCKGVRVRSALMITCSDTWNKAIEIVRGLPLTEIPDSEYIKDNLVMSPELDIRYPDKSSLYIDALSSSDALIFVLHGGSRSDNPVYCGHAGQQFIPAFSIGCLEHSCSRIINAVCCWGARFIGYDRKESILLSSIYDKVLLFAGSCRSVYGRGGQFRVLFPIGFGETFLKYYTNYLFQGLDAGVAMMRAKKEYFNTFSAADRVEMAFGTLMMFNLYGNPLLNVEPLLKPAPILLNVTPMNSLSKGVSCWNSPITYETLFSKKRKGMANGLVDRSVNEIRRRIDSYVYDAWGLRGDRLSLVRSFREGLDRGLIFTYNEEVNELSTSVTVETDLSGGIKEVIYAY